MNAVRIVILCVAAVAAVGLALIVRTAVGDKNPPAAPAAKAPAAAPVAQVLTAARDLPVGARLSAPDLTWQAWPADALNPAFITDGAPPAPAKAKGGVVKAAEQMLGGSGAMKALEGAVVREAVLKGEPILSRKIVRGGEGGFLSAVLRPGKRAVAVPITAESAAGGFILPGDRVDVLQSREVEGLAGLVGGTASNTFVTDVVLSNVRVLAIDQNVEAAKDAKALIGAVATLEVAPGDAEALMQAKARGGLVLTLRAFTDVGGASGAPAGQQDEAGVVRINRGGVVSAAAVRR